VPGAACNTHARNAYSRSTQHASCSMQHAVRSTQHASGSTQHTARSTSSHLDVIVCSGRSLVQLQSKSARCLA
jgi:hypothetical protein